MADPGNPLRGLWANTRLKGECAMRNRDAIIGERVKNIIHYADGLALALGDTQAGDELEEAVNAIREVLGPQHEKKIEAIYGAAASLQAKSVEAAFHLVPTIADAVQAGGRCDCSR